jgi:hypothetical protein
MYSVLRTTSIGRILTLSGSSLPDNLRYNRQRLSRAFERRQSPFHLADGPVDPVRLPLPGQPALQSKTLGFSSGQKFVKVSGVEGSFYTAFP